MGNVLVVCRLCRGIRISASSRPRKLMHLGQTHVWQMSGPWWFALPTKSAVPTARNIKATNANLSSSFRLSFCCTSCTTVHSLPVHSLILTMKFFAVFTILAAAIVAVCASHAETNAVRFARGLPPLPPHRRATPVASAFFILCLGDVLLNIPLSSG